MLLLCPKLSAGRPRESRPLLSHEVPRAFYCDTGTQGDHCIAAPTRVVFRADHTALAAILQQSLAT